MRLIPLRPCLASSAALVLYAATAFADDVDPATGIRWLSWPVTAFPPHPPTKGFVYPQRESFDTQVHKNVIIGLHPDGTVVWKTVSPSESETNVVVEVGIGNKEGQEEL